MLHSESAAVARRRPAGIAHILMASWDVAGDRAAAIETDFVLQAEIIHRKMACLIPIEDVLQELALKLLGLAEEGWRPQEGKSPVAYVVRCVENDLLPSAGIVKAPVVRHSRDSQAIKSAKRDACAPFADISPMAEVLASELPTPLTQLVELQVRSRIETLCDCLRECLPLLFLRQNGGSPLDYQQLRALTKGRADPGPMALPKARRIRIIRAGFALFTRKTFIEVPEAVIEESIAHVLYWRGRRMPRQTDSTSPSYS